MRTQEPVPALQVPFAWHVREATPEKWKPASQLAVQTEPAPSPSVQEYVPFPTLKEGHNVRTQELALPVQLELDSQVRVDGPIKWKPASQLAVQTEPTPSPSVQEYVPFPTLNEGHNV